MPLDLEIVHLPFEVSHIWSWWQQLNKTRSIAMDVGSIEYKEIYAWASLLKISITPFEVEALFAIEEVYLDWRKEEVARNRSKDTS